MAAGFGVETYCLDTLQPGRLVSGKLGLTLALCRRLITRRGKLRGGPEESAYGFDLAGLIGSVADARVLVMAPAMVRGELAKDDRVAGITVTCAGERTAAGTYELELTIDIDPADETESFSFTLAANAVSVDLIGAP